jgi:hypothetical protein
MQRIVLKETLRILARKLRCRPRNKGIKLINKRLLACKLAFAMLEI